MSSKLGKSGVFSRLLRRRKDKQVDPTTSDAQDTASDVQPPAYEDIASRTPEPQENEAPADLYLSLLRQDGKTTSKLQTTWEGCKLGLRVLKEVSEPFGFLKAAVGAFLVLVDTIEDVSSNDTQLLELDNQIRALTTILSRYSSQPLPRQMERRLSGLASALNQQSEYIQQKFQAGFAIRVLDSSKDSAEIVGCFRTLSSLLALFQLDMGVSTELQTEAILQRLTRMDNVSILDKLPRVQDASFRSGNRSECMKGTRSAVLRDLLAWAIDPKGHRVYWLNGLAGIGKSTIAQSFCSLLDSNGLLACSFFCSRNSSTRRDVSRIVPTICYSLSRQLEGYAQNLINALIEDSDAVHYSLSDQFSQLLVTPLSSSDSVPPTARSPVIVVDALDECDSSNATEHLLSAILRHAQDLPLKFFISSRPEPHIWEQFNSSPSTKTVLRLHDIEASIVRDDIRLYLTSRFTQISAKKRYTGWPQSDDIEELVERSDRLFIYAFITVQYVAEAPNPKARLQSLLQKTTRSTLQTAVLDDLYNTVMENAFSKLEEDEEEDLQQLLHFVVSLNNPLSLSDIALLMGRDDVSVMDDLRRFESLLRLPENENSPDPVQIFHASFSDYLADPDRSSQWVINRSSINAFLALKCLQLMNSKLKENMCSIDRATKAAGLPSSTRAAIPDALSYACIHFTSHLSLAKDDDKVILDELANFASSHLLHWMECLSICGALIEVYRSISMIEQYVKGSKNSSVKVPGIWNDVHRLMKQSFEIVEEYPLEAYHSALIWLPTGTSLEVERDTRSSRLPKVVAGLPSDWGSCESVLVHPRARVPALDISPDQAAVLTANGKSVFLWDIGTGQRRKRFDGHTGKVMRVLWGPKGNIFSSARDGTVRIWDPESGEAVQVLRCHAQNVTVMAFLNEQKHLITGSSDGTVCIWDLEKKGYRKPVKKHTLEIRDVSLSFDNRIIASGLTDSSVACLWDTNTGELLHQLTCESEDDRILALAFSPDASMVVAGSWHRTLRFWSLREDGPSLIEHTTLETVLRQATFSPSGAKLALGCRDGTVYVLDGHTRERIAILRGFSTVKSLRFFADESRIIAGFDDLTARMFRFDHDQALASQSDTRGSQKYGISAIALSPDKKWLASSSLDRTVRVWDARTGEGKAWLREQERSICGLAFVPGQDLLVSATTGNTISVWDFRRDVVIHVLRGHTDSVDAVAVTPDGRHIASASRDLTIRTWNVDNLDSSPVVWSIPHRPWCLAYSSDGARLAVGMDSLSMIVWNTVTYAEDMSMVYANKDGCIRQIVFSSDGSQITAASRNGHAHIFTISTGEKRKIPRPYEPVRLQDGSLVVHDKAKSSISIVMSSVSPYFVFDNCILRRLMGDGSVEDVCHLAPTYRDIECKASYGPMLYLGHYGGVVTFLDMSAYEASQAQMERAEIEE